MCSLKAERQFSGDGMAISFPHRSKSRCMAALFAVNSSSANSWAFSASNTVANKANALLNLPDDPQHPEVGNVANTAKARALYREAKTIFVTHGMAAASAAVAEALAGIAGADADFGTSRVRDAPTH